MSITHIVATSNNHVIGMDNKLPWHIPEDLKRFKDITHNKVVYMGSNTFRSILPYFTKGTILPGRTVIVISSSVDNCNKLQEEFGKFSNVNYWTKGILDYYLQNTPNAEHLIIGGEKLFLAYPPDKVYATIVDVSIEGDAYYPYGFSNMDLINEEKQVSSNGIKFSFNTYIKK